MAAQIALLRAINVGGTKKIGMAELRAFMTGAGFKDVQSLLQTGNLVFRASGKTGAALESFLEKEAGRVLGLETDFFVRSAEEWKEIIARNPMPDEAKRDPAHLVVLCLKHAPTNEQVENLRAAISGPETVQAAGKETYIFYPAGIGESRLTIKVIEKHLATRATGRNWNTVLKLGALAALL